MLLTGRRTASAAAPSANVAAGRLRVAALTATSSAASSASRSLSATVRNGATSLSSSSSSFSVLASALERAAMRFCSTTSTPTTNSEGETTIPTFASSQHSNYSSKRRSFQPFTEKDEQDLINVMSSKPRHVLRHVRQSIWRGRKRELHFRATVTHLMIVLQDFLRRQQIEPSGAAIILEGTMEECVRLSQHDMAHLLFRAFLRFRKYGCKISLDALRLLFDSYRGTDNAEMMLQLATEMSTDPELRAFCIAAYLYAGRVDEAEKLRAAIPSSQLETKDVIAMIHGYQKLQMPDKIVGIVRGLSNNSSSSGGSGSGSSETSQEELGEIVAAALKAFYEGSLRGGWAAGNSGSSSSSSAENNNNICDTYFNECFDIGRRLEVAFPASAFATVLRHKLRRAVTMADVTAVENELRSIGYVPDLTGNSVIVAAYARMLHFGDKGSEEVMLSKVDTLLSSIESRLKQNDPDADVSSAHLRAVLRGYGAAGRPELMKKAWEAVQCKGLSNDTRVYNELLKWFCLMGNVKDALRTKSEMVRDEVQPDATTFTWLMRALGKFYPRQAEKFYEELRILRIRPDPALYATLIGTFGDLGNVERVEELRAEISQREGSGTLPVSASTYAVLLRIYRDDVDKVEALWKEIQSKGIAEHDHIVTSMLHAYASFDAKEKQKQQLLHHQQQKAAGGGGTSATRTATTAAAAGGGANKKNDDELASSSSRLNKFLQSLPQWSTSVYNVVLHMYGRRGDIGKVNELVEKMKADGTQLNDVTFGTLVSLYGKAKMTDKVADVMEMIKQQEGQVSASFYSILASTYSKLGDTDGIDEAWEDMVASRLFPDTETYNAFLTLYSKHHNVRKMQVVLDSMLKHVPPNPITSTTVVDMMGKSGRLSEMEDLVADMKKQPETAPTTVTFHQLMNAYAKAGDVIKMEKARDEYLASGFKENAVTFNILCDGYGRSRRFEQVTELLDRRRALGIPMEELAYCVLISNYGRARLTNEVTRLGRELKGMLVTDSSAESSSSSSSTAAASGSSSSSSSDSSNNNQASEGQTSSSSAAAAAPAPATTSTTTSMSHPTVSRKVHWAMIDALCRCNDTAAMSEWITLLTKDAPLSSSDKNQLIAYYGRCGMLDHVDAIAQSIEEAGDDVSFTALNATAKAFARQGRFDKCVEALHKLRDREMVPDAATALTLSQMFIRAGLHEQAQQIIQWRRFHARSGQAETESEDVIV